MTATSPGLKLKRQPKISYYRFGERRRPDPLDTFGVDALVGPKGSGKTLLAVHRARRYAMGMVKRPGDGGCACGDERCPNTDWKVYTNLESTWKGHPKAAELGGGWAEPIDVATQVLDQPEDTHVVLLPDEGYQYADARRSTTNSAIEITDEITQARKAKVMTLITGVSFDWLDKRIRAQVRQTYNCWTPNRGRSVYAVVTLISTGHLPPWKRARRPSRIMRWDTSVTRRFYNTHERIDARDEVKAAMRESTILVPDQAGELTLYNISEIVDMIVFDKAARGEQQLDPRQLAGELQERAVPVSPAQVARQLGLAGFPRTPQGTFIIRATEPLGDLTQ